MENADKLFEKALKIKLRFPYKGSISTEDLWDLSLNDLDFLFRSVNKDLKSVHDGGLIERKSGGSVLELQTEIIKRVYASKREDIERKEKAFARREQVRQLSDIIAQKENTALTEKSLDDLKKMRDELEGYDSVPIE